jgi:hypothetical protein
MLNGQKSETIQLMDTLESEVFLYFDKSRLRIVDFPKLFEINIGATKIFIFKTYKKS